MTLDKTCVVAATTCKHVCTMQENHARATAALQLSPLTLHAHVTLCNMPAASLRPCISQHTHTAPCNTACPHPPAVHTRNINRDISPTTS
jgi:hypothetical protein